MAITKNKLKYIVSLKQKKNRDDEKLFIAEGEKIVGELLLSGFETTTVVAVSGWIEANSSLLLKTKAEVIEVGNTDLERMSSLKTPNNVLAIAKQPTAALNIVNLKNKLTIVLDDLQDPGNLGTIMRLADWFGIENIICSENTVDAYSPKVVQATMGAFLRVKTHYTNLFDFLPNAKGQQIQIFGTFLNGQNIYNAPLMPEGLIIMGNESKGINPLIEKLVGCKLTIPSGATKGTGAESLNVSIAAALVCGEFFRRFGKF